MRRLAFPLGQLRTLAAITLAATLLSACGGAPRGRPFDAGPASTLALGSSTRAQAVAALGPPVSERAASYNKDLKGQPLELPLVTRVLHYEYVEPSSSGAIPWVTPARELNVVMVDDVVLGYLLRSTFKGDCTDFEPLNASGLTRGVSTRADVIARLGPPPGRSLWPLAMSPGGELWSYGVDLDNKATHTRLRKRLTVYIDAHGTVEDFVIDQKETDTRPPAPTGGTGGYTPTPVYVPPPTSAGGSFKSR
jgi:hypothetical protein